MNGYSSNVLSWNTPSDCNPAPSTLAFEILHQNSSVSNIPVERILDLSTPAAIVLGLLISVAIVQDLLIPAVAMHLGLATQYNLASVLVVMRFLTLHHHWVPMSCQFG